MEDVVVLDVHDDGRGFVTAAAVGTGYGLTGMRERVQALKGTWSVESLPGEGTTVSFSLPALPSSGGIPLPGGGSA
jgi:signal transduction histidine kinase